MVAEGSPSDRDRRSGARLPRWWRSRPPSWLPTDRRLSARPRWFRQLDCRKSGSPDCFHRAGFRRSGCRSSCHRLAHRRSGRRRSFRPIDRLRSSRRGSDHPFDCPRSRPQDSRRRMSTRRLCRPGSLLQAGPTGCPVVAVVALGPDLPDRGPGSPGRAPRLDRLPAGPSPVQSDRRRRRTRRRRRELRVGAFSWVAAPPTNNVTRARHVSLVPNSDVTTSDGPVPITRPPAYADCPLAARTDSVGGSFTVAYRSGNCQLPASPRPESGRAGSRRLTTDVTEGGAIRGAAGRPALRAWSS